MKLYFSPLACSLASRITLEEIGADVTYVEVHRGTKVMEPGGDYRQLYELGLVPALDEGDGVLLTENLAILRRLSEGSELDRGPRVDQWLSYVATELHKGTFAVFFDTSAPDEAKRWAMQKGAGRLAHVERHLSGRSYLTGRLSAADFYLYVVLNWLAVTPLELADYPALEAFHARLGERPSVRRAFRAELPLYRAAQSG